MRAVAYYRGLSYTVRNMEIPLHRRDGSVSAVAIVDEDDYADLAAHSWYLGTRGYAMRQYREPTDPPGQRRIRAELMHRRIMHLRRGDGLEVDHKDRNKLNNRRDNLRVLTHAENEQNKVGARGRSGVRGVVWYADRQGWVARLIVNGKWKTRSYFDTVEEAAEAMAKLRAEHHPYAP